MKKISTIIVIAVFTASFLVSCKEAQQNKEVANHHEDSEGGMHNPNGHPPRGEGDIKVPPSGDGHPPRGDRKGSPGGGHGPEQTKTLKEIGGYNIGEVATDFSLKNVDGSLFSLADIDNAKGYIVTFTCNECPFAKMYEDRLIELHKTYAPQGYSVVAINPNTSGENEKEGFEAMQKRAKEKNFPFVYLVDEGQKIYPQYGAVRTPHVFLLDKERKVQYIGSIDDNARSAEDVKVKYIEEAISALEKGEKPNPNLTKAIGCPVKAKRS